MPVTSRTLDPKVETGFGKNPMLKHKDSAAARFDLRVRLCATRGNIKRNTPFPAVERRLVQPDRPTDVDAALGPLLKDAKARAMRSETNGRKG
ncbi:hypothetical protein BQ8482_90071 [Mesorhizobium delmotii]|uniref:Uncharacterized protein n=1 Tax=Mesorhizobium delmotii TaxID=1631247 RepID=A0A2P9AX50_9HYPH|nr:hypothetical protein BQ8482_90071 [Mesorhizobium delmotii]